MNDFGFSQSEAYVIARRAYEYALQGAYEPASVLLEGLLAADPGDRYAVLTLAAVRIKQGRADEAVELLAARRRADARDEEIACLLVEAHAATGRKAEAESLRTELEALGIELPERIRLRLRASGDAEEVRRIEA